ncbi:MAG: glycosyltransferase [Armatimonadetes bacterium]|nr:glycosyltransferase [Armatimonadota bacterium]
MTHPQISVVIPIYNRGALIGKTVASALAQDLASESVEILLVDDGSTDDTWTVLQSLYASHPQIRLFRLENGGVARARNFGLEQARGEFIAYLDHDDLWKPQKLRLQREAMQRSEKIGVVTCSWVSVDAAGEEMPPVIQFQRQWWWRGRDGRAFPWVLLPHPLQFIRNPIISMTIPLIRTKSLRDVGGFDVQSVPSDDWDLWIRLAQRFDFAYVDEELACYVHHEGQQHRQMRTTYASEMRICEKYRVSWRKYPWVHFKQECFRRKCRALINHADATQALSEGNNKGLILLTIKAIFQRPDILIMRRWHRLWLRALKGNFE